MPVGREDAAVMTTAAARPSHKIQCDDECPDHRPEFIGYRLAPWSSWMQLAHSYLRDQIWLYRCPTCNGRQSLFVKGEDLPKEFDRARRSSKAEESPRAVSRTVINT
jgi:hypothetical protein